MFMGRAVRRNQRHQWRNVVGAVMTPEEQARWAAIKQQSTEFLKPKSEPAQPSPPPPEDFTPMSYEEMDQEAAHANRLLRDHQQKREAKTVAMLQATVHQMFEAERDSMREVVGGALAEFEERVVQRVMTQVASQAGVSGALAQLKEQIMIETDAAIAESIGALKAELVVQRAIETPGSIVAPFKKVVQ